MAKSQKRSRATAKPVADPAPADTPVDAEEVVASAKTDAVAPARAVDPAPATEPQVAATAYDVDAFLAEAREACAEAIEAGGGLNPALPGSYYGTVGYKLMPNHTRTKSGEFRDPMLARLEERRADGEPNVPELPPIDSVVFYLRNGQKVRHRRRVD